MSDATSFSQSQELFEMLGNTLDPTEPNLV